MVRIDMDMPDSCSECRFCVPIITITCLEYDCFCSASSKLKYPKAETGFCISRPNWCPLHPIETFGDGICTKSPSGEEERFTLYRDSLTERKEEQP